jgi:hypothetical protein
MQFKFDANQDFQLQAIEAVTALFTGQPRIETDLRFTLGPSTLLRAGPSTMLRAGSAGGDVDRGVDLSYKGSGEPLPNQALPFDSLHGIIVS